MEEEIEITIEAVPVKEIAQWLRQQTDTWWAVDGDQRLESRIQMPATNQDLADALDKFCEPDETLNVLVPADVHLEGTARLFSGGNGRRQLTAEGGYDDDGWILVEQTDWVKEANAEVEAWTAGTTGND